VAVYKKSAPSLEAVRAIFTYDPESGVLSRRWHKQGNCRVVLVDGVEYMRSRIIWFYQTGEWPEEIDHRDGNEGNNRWENLRKCTHAQNLMNRCMPKHNKIGIKGVQRHQNGFRARIRVNGVMRRGEFATAEEAGKAYRHWSNELHGEFGRVV